MHDPKTEGARWLDQAENDLAFAAHAMAGEFYHQVCFNAQQSAEKALKAIHYADGARSVIGHSVVGLLTRLTELHPGLTSLQDFAAELDLFYIATRYPNGLIEGTPHKAFTRSQAERALTAGEAVLNAARHEISA